MHLKLYQKSVKIIKLKIKKINYNFEMPKKNRTTIWV